MLTMRLHKEEPRRLCGEGLIELAVWEERDDKTGRLNMIEQIGTYQRNVQIRQLSLKQTEKTDFNP